MRVPLTMFFMQMMMSGFNIERLVNQCTKKKNKKNLRLESLESEKQKQREYLQFELEENVMKIRKTEGAGHVET